ncbi:MAG TPA: POTRA domain-containing protein [Thermoanaerobaculia bacterium]|nr:POTRA domain-containing protein [Thermoanaerobaculia bacterium]
MSPYRGAARFLPSELRCPGHLAIAFLLVGCALLVAEPAGARNLFFFSTPEAAATEPAVPIPPGAVIGEIRVVTRNIFDPKKPGEDRWIFRIANRLHRTTRPGVVESQLLFRPGDVYSPDQIEESARLLRENSYLYDAEIRPVLREDGKVDIEVVTRDVWTLEGGAGFSRSGGENTTSFNVTDSNFLGTGKDLTVSRIGTVDRTSDLLRYRDPNVAGTRARLFLSVADNSDGGRERLELERPFYSLDTRWAAGVRVFHDDRIDRIFKAGKATTGFRHEQDFVEAYGGISPGLRNGVTNRFRAGFTFSRETFELEPGLFPKAFVPANRTLSYPWIGFDSVQDRFVVEHDLNQIQRAEDLNLGRQIHARLGFSSPAFGADREHWIAEAGTSAGWRPGSGQLLLASVGGSTRWAESEAENLLVSGNVRWYLRNFGKHLLFASLSGDIARNLDDEDQLLLGGDSGLRGYPLRFQTGDRRVLFTVEQRFFSNLELFHLATLGAAVFFDAGQAWFIESESSQERQLLKDVGIGLRLGSIRSSRGAVVHLDAAFPLDGDDSIDRVQWLISTRESF